MTKEEYGVYLESERWKALRLEALSRAHWRCQVCGVHSSKADLEVHHRCYKKLAKPGELADVIAMCEHCHSLFHEHKRICEPSGL